MRFKSWSERSLTSWMIIGMCLALLPLWGSVLLVHGVVNRGVIGAFDDLARRNRDQLRPIQDLQVGLWEAAVPVDEYLGDHESTHASGYREWRRKIEGYFAHLESEFRGDPETAPLLTEAKKHWRAADQVATELFAHDSAHHDQSEIELTNRFNGFVASSTDAIRVLQQDLAHDLEADHDDALLANERGEWISGIAFGFSLVAMLAGVGMIVRIMLANIQRLLVGARRFAEGDRKHRIRIKVPPELREVADEFNNMIGQVAEAERALATQARVDPLTGLGNRRAFDDALQRAYARMRRRGERFVLAILDIDYFKKVNDTHGHAAGDEVLASVARTVAGTLREVDGVFRIGGEEFAILLADTNLAGGMVAAERLRQAVATHPVEAEGTELTVTASVGLACANGDYSGERLQRSADRALYDAKEQGRNRVVSASEVTDAGQPMQGNA